jgi:signal transduction histidine kinase
MSHAIETPIVGRPGTPGDPSAENAAAVRQIAHQLRQPLSTMEAIAYYLSITLPPHETKALEQVVKLQRLVQDTNLILSDAVHYLRASPSHPVRVELNGIVTDAVSEIRMFGGPLSPLSCGPNPVPVWIDAAQAAHMAQSLLNYFRQVLPATDPIEISVSAAGGEARVAFRTASSACTPEQLLSLLQPDRPRLGSGSGLAMASVRRIVDAHGGRIEVEAWPPAGVQLEIIFPLAD